METIFESLQLVEPSIVLSIYFSLLWHWANRQEVKKAHPRLPAIAPYINTSLLIFISLTLFACVHAAENAVQEKLKFNTHPLHITAWDSPAPARPAHPPCPSYSASCTPLFSAVTVVHKFQKPTDNHNGKKLVFQIVRTFEKKALWGENKLINKLGIFKTERDFFFFFFLILCHLSLVWYAFWFHTEQWSFAYSTHFCTPVT